MKLFDAAVIGLCQTASVLPRNFTFRLHADRCTVAWSSAGSSSTVFVSARHSGRARLNGTGHHGYRCGTLEPNRYAGDHRFLCRHLYLFADRHQMADRLFEPQQADLFRSLLFCACDLHLSFY